MKRTIWGIPLRSLIVCYIVVLAIFLTVASALMVSDYQRKNTEYVEEQRATANAALSNLSSTFTRGIDTAYNIMASRWYSHLLNISDVFKDDFNPWTCLEYSRQLAWQVSDLDFTEDILLIVPSNDVVLSSRGWMSLHNFDLAYGKEIEIRAVPGENFAPIIELMDEDLFCFKVPNKVKRAKQSAIFILYSQKALEKYMSSILPSVFLYGQIIFEDNIVWEYGQARPDGLSFTLTGAYPAFSLRIDMPSWRDIYLKSELLQYGSVFILILFASLFIALILSKLILLPIIHALSRGNRSNDDFVGDPVTAIDGILTHSALLQSRNDQIYRYISSLEREILYGLINDPSKNAYDPSVQEVIPWIQDGLPYLMMITQSEPEEISPQPKHKISMLLPDVFCTVIWFDKSADAEMARAMLSSLHGICLSPFEKDPASLSATFSHLYDEYQRVYLVQHSIPMEILYEFYGHIIAGRETDCLNLIDQMRTRYSPDALEHHVMRFAVENGLSANTLDGTWDGIEACVESLTSLVNEKALNEPGHDVEAIRAYIDENYANPDMSLKLLCEHFSIGRTLISQLIKAQSGQTFLEYLTSLRMEKACELLKSNSSVSSVGESVGYLSYSTFKRAFQRRFGISPREWREEYLEKRQDQ